MGEPSRSCGRPTPGIASATEHAEQTDAQEHQARRLGDGSDGDNAGGAVPVEQIRCGRIRPKSNEVAAAAARDVDATEVAGKPTRPNFDEHPTATAAATA